MDDPGEAQRLTETVRTATDLLPGRARDGFVYEFTIVTTTTTERLELTGAQLTEAVRTDLGRIRHA